MEIILVRHGESIGNALKGEDAVYTGRWDCDLTENGYEQARMLKGNPFIEGADTVYVSGLRRALETAETITDKKLIIDHRIVERSLGDFEGRKIADIKKDPDYARYFSDPTYKDFRNSFQASAPGGESYSDVCIRVRPFLDDLRKSRHHKVLIVSHFVVIRCLIKEIQGLTEEETLSLKVANCTPIQISWSVDG